MKDLLHESCCEMPKPQKTSLFEAPTLQIKELKLIHALLEESIFTWKNFEACLPPSLLEVFSGSDYHSSDAVEIFVPTDVIEYKNSGKRLNRHQLAQLRRFGKFDVKSPIFSGQYHTWHLTSFLQHGKINLFNDLKSNLRKALELMVIGLKNRFVGNCFSVKLAAYSLLDFFQMIFDLFIGWPHTHQGDIEKKLLTERLNFLTSDLSVKKIHRYQLEEFWYFAERISLCPDHYKLSANEHIPKLPFYFITPSNLLIDLRSYNNCLLEKCIDIINKLRQSINDGWFETFKTNEYSSLKGSGKSFDEIKSIIHSRGLHEFSQRLFDAMRHSPELQAIDSTIAEELIKQANFHLAVQDAKQRFAESWFNHKRTIEQYMGAAKPLLWSLPLWREQYMSAAKQQFMQVHKLDVHKALLSRCESSGLHQFAYFIKRDLLFLTEREQLVHDELTKAPEIADNIFEYRVPCRILRHWRVYKRDPLLPSRKKKKTTKVGTVLFVGSLSKYESTQSLSHDANRNENSAQTNLQLESDVQAKPNLINESLKFSESPRTVFDPEYTTSKHWTFKSSNGFVFWRWFIFFTITFAWLLRGCQLFLYTIPFLSSLSLSALCLRKPIYLSAEIDQKTGYLFYTNQKITNTIWQRLSLIWQSAQVKINSSSSCFYKFLVYFVNGVLPTLVIATFLPILCLLTSTLSIAFGLLLPFLVPMISLVIHILGTVFWDAYKSEPIRWFPIPIAFIWHLGVRCIFQCLGALFTGLVIYPLASVTICLYGLFNWAWFSLWDIIVFHVVLKHFLGIPIQENCILKRKSGAQLLSGNFIKADLTSVAMVLISRLENIELEVWKRQVELIAQEPTVAYNALVANLAYFSFAPVETGVLSQLRISSQEWMQDISAKVKARRKFLNLHLPKCQLKGVKMSANELQQFEIIGPMVAKKFYQVRILPRLQQLGENNPSDWWTRQRLQKDDFSGLTANLLEDVFGEQFFASLTGGETVFPLQISNHQIISGISNLLKMLSCPEFATTTSAEMHSIRFSDYRSYSLPQTPNTQIKELHRKRRTMELSSKQPNNSNEALSLLSDDFCSETSTSNRKICSAADTVRFVGQVLSCPKLRSAMESDSHVFLRLDFPMLPLIAFIPQLYQQTIVESYKQSINIEQRQVSSSINRCCRCCRASAFHLIPSNFRLDEFSSECVTILLHEAMSLHRSSNSLWETSSTIPCRRRYLVDILQTSFTRQKDVWSYNGALPNIMDQIGLLQHPIEIALMMHSRIRENRYINRKHPILVNFIKQTLLLPPRIIPNDVTQVENPNVAGKVMRLSKSLTLNSSECHPQAVEVLFNSVHNGRPSSIIETPDNSRVSVRIHDGLDFNSTSWWGDPGMDYHDFTDVPSAATTSFLDDDDDDDEEEDQTNHDVEDIESMLDNAVLGASTYMFVEENNLENDIPTIALPKRSRIIMSSYHDDNLSTDELQLFEIPSIKASNCLNRPLLPQPDATNATCSVATVPLPREQAGTVDSSTSFNRMAQFLENSSCS